MEVHARHKLESFLEVARKEGEFDSEGQFTLNRHKAAGKLASYLLPSGGYWLLKLLQAACIARADSLEISESQTTISIVLKLSQPLSHYLLQKSLLEPGLEDNWTSKLAQSLRAVGIGESRSWVGTLRGQEQCTELACSGGELSLKTGDFADSAAGSTLRLTVEAASDDDYPETGLLFYRGVASSVPLRVNGIRLDHLQFPQDQRGRSYPLGVRWIISPGANPLRIPSGVRGNGIWNYVPAFTVNSRVNRMMAAHFHYVTIHGGASIRALPTESSFNLVRDGVIVCSRALNLTQGIAVDIFLYADDSMMDISGLRAEPPAGLIENAEEEITAFNGSLRDLGRQMSELRWRPKEHQILAWCGLGLAGTLLSPLLTPVIGMGAVGWTLKKLRRDHQVRHRAIDSLEAFRKNLPLVIRR